MKAFVFAACISLLVATKHAQADASPVGIWVDLEVSRCEAVTFEAPSNKPGMYLPGDKYRTAQVTGHVMAAGLLPYDSSQAWIREHAEQAKKRLPASKAELTLVLRQWDAPFCQAAVGKVVRFNYEPSCDTWPLTGYCLPPHPLVRPASR